MQHIISCRYCTACEAWLLISNLLVVFLSDGLPYVRDRCHVCHVCLSVCLSVCLQPWCMLWPNGWTDEDATWYGGTPRPKRHCVRWRPSSPSTERGKQLPTFRPMSIVSKRSPISAITAELLSDSMDASIMHCVRVYRVPVYKITRQCIKFNEYGGSDEIRW